MRMRPGTLLASMLAVVLVCGGSLYGLARYLDRPDPVPQGDIEPLTLTQVQERTRLTFPEGTKLTFGEFYVLVDWAVAAQVRITPDQLGGFLRANGLPKPVDGLRTVPGGIGTAPAGAPSGGTDAGGTDAGGTDAGGTGGPALGSLQPDPSAASGGSGAARAGASAHPTPTVQPSPAASVPSGARRLLGDDRWWHPEAAGSISGIDRNVNSGVARWLTFEFDDPSVVTVYVYAVAEVPEASRTPYRPSRSAGAAKPSAAG